MMVRSKAGEGREAEEGGGAAVGEGASQGEEGGEAPLFGSIWRPGGEGGERRAQ